MCRNTRGHRAWWLAAVGLAACGAFGGEGPAAPGDAGPESGAVGGDASATADAAVTDAAAAADGPITPTPDGGLDALPALDAATVPSCGGNPACERVVFVTSLTTNGTFGFAKAPFAVADKLCNDLALASGNARVRGATFQAWLSAGTTSAAARLVHGTGRYVDPTGALVAMNWTGLVSANLFNAINRDENGNALLPINPYVWTATQTGGVAATPDCDTWVNASGEGVFGIATSTTNTWTKAGQAACVEPKRFYCFEY